MAHARPRVTSDTLHALQTQLAAAAALHAQGFALDGERALRGAQAITLRITWTTVRRKLTSDPNARSIPQRLKDAGIIDRPFADQLRSTGRPGTPFADAIATARRLIGLIGLAMMAKGGAA